MMVVNALKNLWSVRHDVAGAAVYWSGLAGAFERATGTTGAIVLMYHSIAADEDAPYIDPPNRIAPALFERQMAFLRRHRRVVSYSQLVQHIAAGDTPPAGTVCITFDDGYRDNLTVAAPVLERHGLPATLFVATGYVQRQQMQWADALHCHFRLRRAHRLALPQLGLDLLDLSNAAERQHARTALHRHLLTATFDEREAVLAQVAQQLQPQGERPRTSLDWDDVRELRCRYPAFELGGHTRDHIDLRSHTGELAVAEIAGCARDLERETGEAPRDFSFPYGRWCARTQDLVRAAGWRSAVGAGTAVRIGAQSDRFALPRVNAPASMTALRFKTSGAYPGAVAMLGGV